MSAGLLRHAWYNTPNIRFLTIADFEEFCGEYRIRIHQRIALDTEEGKVVSRDANLFAGHGDFCNQPVTPRRKEMVSQKCQYAIRATFELAKRHGQGPVKISEIAETQSIPVRFLEVILNQLRQGGFVQSRRGADGGYYLIRKADELMVGDIIQFIEGPLVPVACLAEKASQVRTSRQLRFYPHVEARRKSSLGCL